MMVVLDMVRHVAGPGTKIAMTRKMMIAGTMDFELVSRCTSVISICASLTDGSDNHKNTR